MVGDMSSGGGHGFWWGMGSGGGGHGCWPGGGHGVWPGGGTGSGLRPCPFPRRIYLAC